MRAPLQRLDAEARPLGLALRGALHDGETTICLFGPDEPAFWPIFAAAPEYSDGLPDPMDRWSKRVLGGLAQGWGAAAIFPSDRPFAPFLTWAVDSGRAWPSPVQLLVHDEAGLFISYRGALRLPGRLPLPEPRHSPCPACAAPCLTACPVGAMTPDGYDVPRCKSHITSPEGQDCLTEGCRVRRACPVSQTFGRLHAQSAFHMAAFA